MKLSPFEQGYDGHSKGLGQAENPYDKESSPYSRKEWDRGWAARARLHRK